MTFYASIRSRFRPQYFLVVTFGAMLLASWQRWTSMIVDIGRETDLPFRIMNGEMLYRDIHYIYPPFSPYFNAGLYWIFGVHLNTLVVSGIFCTMLLTYLCYRLSRKIMSASDASITTSFIVALCFFKPAGNLILSYSFAGVHAAVFSLATVLFILLYAENRKKRDLIAAGVFIGLAAITKQEFAFASAVTATIYLLTLHRLNLRALFLDLFYTAIPAFAIALPVFVALFATIEWRILVDDCHLFYTKIPESLIFYNRFRSGMNYPVGSFIQMIGAAALSTALVASIMFFSDRTRILKGKLILAFVISSTIVAVILYFFIADWDGSPIRALPFLLLAMILVGIKSEPRFRSGISVEETSRRHLVFIVAVYSLAIILRVVLRVPSGGFSGSFYLPTSLILIFYALLRLVPEAVRKLTDDERSYLRAALITTAICVIAVGATVVSFTFRYLEKYNYRITAQRGSVFAEKDSGPAIGETLKFIESNTAEGEFIAVLPEGNDLAFLTGRRINLRHQVLIPGFLSEQDELDAIAALKKGGVRYIFVPNRAMREFGAVAFGRDFYQTLGNWIEENYQVIKVFGGSENTKAEIGDPKFFIKVYARKNP